jgi:hypothetical protein
MFFSALAGPTCDSFDTISLDVEIPELYVGDVVYAGYGRRHPLGASGLLINQFFDERYNFRRLVHNIPDNSFDLLTGRRLHVQPRFGNFLH